MPDTMKTRNELMEALVGFAGLPDLDDIAARIVDENPDVAPIEQIPCLYGSVHLVQNYILAKIIVRGIIAFLEYAYVARKDPGA